MKEGMKSPTMPKTHSETKQKQALQPSKKYGTEFGNAESYDKMNSGLASFVKKHQMKYE